MNVENFFLCHQAGVYPAIPTPFIRNGDLDWTWLKKPDGELRCVNVRPPLEELSDADRLNLDDFIKNMKALRKVVV